METGYSLSDISAVTGGMNGLGGNNSLVTLLLLFALMSGNWNNRGDYGQYATAASQQEILFGQKFSDLDNKMDRGFTNIGNGISNLGYTLTNNIKDGNAAVAGRVVDEGRALQAQLSDHNCTTQRNIDSVRFDMANYYNAITNNIDNKFAQLEKNQMQAQIDALKQENQQIYLAQQMCGVVRYPMDMSYTAGRSPFCNCNTGCGCNCGNI